MEIKKALVDRICAMWESIKAISESDCHGVALMPLAADLLHACGIKHDQIIEVPLCWSSQVAIVFRAAGRCYDFGCGQSKTDGAWFEEIEAL